MINSALIKCDCGANSPIFYGPDRIKKAVEWHNSIPRPTWVFSSERLPEIGESVLGMAKFGAHVAIRLELSRKNWRTVYGINIPLEDFPQWLDLDGLEP